MDLIVPGNGLVIWQVVGLVLLAGGVTFFGYMGYLGVKALRKYTAKK
jgi:hypothetical protein